MDNVIVIIDFDDIPAAVKLAADLPSYVIYTFDPVLVDKIALQNLKNIELLAWDDCPDYAQLEAWSHRTAFELETVLAVAVKRHLPALLLDSWQHLNLFYLLMKLKWYSGLWEAMKAQFSNATIHLLICDKPSEYNFHSFLPALLLMQILRRENIEFSAFVYGVHVDNSGLVPGFLDGQYVDRTETVLTHLPTCFYDIYHFNDEMKASGKTFVNIKSKHYDMPVFSASDVALVNVEQGVAALPAQLQADLLVFRRVVSTVLDGFFSAYIATVNYRQRQVEFLCNIYVSQATTYFLLEQYFDKIKPTKLMLSDRDMGFHGPIVSFAKNHHIPVLLLPHSKTTNNMEYSYDNMVSLSHPIQGDNIRNASGKTLLNFSLTYPGKFFGSSMYPSPIKKIALVLNAQAASGIYFSNYSSYIKDIKKIVAWCEKNRVELSIRCKPSYSLFKLLAKETGLDSQRLIQDASISMEQFSSECDLCLMYDSPTSGVIEFLAKSIPIIHTVSRSLSESESTFVNARVVPRENVDETLHRLEHFLTDLNSFFHFRHEQFRRYLNLFKDAKPLRTYL